MDMSMDLPTDPYMAKVYWMFAGGTIVLASIIHLFDRLIYHQRLSAVSSATLDPARPKNPLLRWYATATAITREAIYYTVPLVPSLHERYLVFPPFGRTLLITANLALLFSLALYGFDVRNRHNWEPIAIRCGWVTITQLPLVFLLAGKRNLIGYITGTSYERLNWIHRWVSRCMFLTASIHLSHFLRTWAQYDYITAKFKIDIISRRGLGAWSVLLWIVLSSLAPVRGWRYEFFVVQHVVSVVVFVTMVMLHAPAMAQHFVWLPVGFFFGDRSLRFCFVAYNNFGLFHGTPKRILTCKATFHPLLERATRVSISNPPFKWSPGQHALLTLPSLTGLQSHPFSIISLPSDNTLDFVIRAQAGATHTLFSHTTSALPPLSDVAKTAIIDGPYGQMREMEQFDTVILLAGGTGACFIVPLLRDLVRRKKEQLPVVTKRVKLVWVVKRRGQIEWFSKELRDVVNSAAEMESFVVKASVYVTCDDSLTTDDASTQESEGNEVGKQQETKAKNTDTTASEILLCSGDVCRCQETLEDKAKDAISSTPSPPAGSYCCCWNPRPSPELKGAKSISALLSLPDEVSIVSGRPAVRTLIEKQVEKAYGEAAAVVCGPPGLIDAARMAVVELSDERAIHKGTGAQGLYLHCEAFCI